MVGRKGDGDRHPARTTQHSGLQADKELSGVSPLPDYEGSLHPAPLQLVEGAFSKASGPR